MRGLPFPQDAAFDRETSYEYGTPASNPADIPIDPALAEAVIDPSLQRWDDTPNYTQVGFPPQAHPLSGLHHTDYSQGPQGDPFAPPPPPAYFPPEEQAPSPARPKKRRRVKKESECGFCQGNSKKNKDGETEPMVSCEECGRSGHPSCMDLGEIGDKLHTYPWTCVECKICEICQEKGDDARILFCDSCDRGWHMDCLNPPLESSPPGKWYCPACTHNPAGVCGPPDVEEATEELQVVRDSSVASTSRVQLPPVPKRSKKKSKRRAASPDESEIDIDGPETPVVSRGRTRQTTASARKSVTENSPIKRPHLTINPPRKMVVRLRLSQQGKGKEKEESGEEEPPKGLFEDILTEVDRDTTKTLILNGDKIRFDRSRHTAEGKLVPATATPQSLVPSTPIAGPSTRATRSSAAFTPITPIGRSTSPTPSTPGPSHLSAPGLRIRTIRFGAFDIQTWYDAPFPEEYANIPDGRLWICEFCLKYNKSRFGAARHCMKCKARHPPGDEIYRDGVVSIFEVDGRRNKIYCQHLCLLSKMFLDHKSLFYDVEPFLFYVMTEVDDAGARFVGYFSKEKRSPKDYNVSCIMTLPVRQRQGWGNLLIEFSYLLSKKEQRLGSPEKPLSGLGALGYKNYWTLSVMRYLQTAPDSPSLEDIARATSMTLEDIYNTLVDLDFISVASEPPQRPLPGQAIKFPKGRKSSVARRHLIRTQTTDEDSSKTPFILPTSYDIRWERPQVDAYLAKWEAKGYLKIKPEKLKWSPFLLARVKKSDAAEVLGDDSPAPATVLASPVVETPAPVTPIVFTRGDEDEIEDKDEGQDGDSSVRLSSRSPSKRTTRSPEQSTTRRLRSSQTVHTATPPMPTRRSSAPAPAPAAAPSPVRRRVTRQSTSPVKLMRARSPSPMDIDIATRDRDRFDEDAALAARLAREEAMQGRLLRSRSATGLDLKRTVSASSKAASRKRRRIDSSPEPEPDTDVGPRRANALGGGATVDLNVSLPVQRSRPPTHELHLDVEAEAGASAQAVAVVASGTDAHEEVKSEFDSGTPFTAVMSRQSAPSDDTVYAAGAPSSKGDVDSPLDIIHSAGDGEDGDAGAVIAGAEDAVARPASVGNVDADVDVEGEDADAEGDDDPDAEGEPDTEL